MIDPVAAFRDGGPLMLAILGVLSVLQLAVVALYGSLLLRLRLPSAIWVALGAVPLLLGLFGTIQGVGMAMAAVASVSPENLVEVASAGTAISLYTTIAGALSSELLFVSFSMGTGLGLLSRPGKEARFTWANTVVAVLVLLVVTPVALWFVGPIAGFAFSGAMGGMVLGSLRFPVEEARDRARAANGRAATALYGVLALGCAALASGALAMSRYYEVQAYASREMMRVLLEDAAFSGPMVFGGTAGLAVVLLVTLPFVVGPGMRELDGRGAVTAVVASITLLPTVGLGGAAAWQLSTLTARARPAAEVRAEALGGIGLKVPSASGELVRARLIAMPTLTFAGTRRLLDDQPVSSPTAVSAGLLAIEAPEDLPLTELAPWVTAAGERVCLEVRTPELRCLFLSAASAGPDARDPDPAGFGGGSRLVRPHTRVQHRPDGWVMHFEDPATEASRTRHRLGVPELKAALAEIRAERAEDGVQVWFPPEAKVSDYVALIEGISEPAPMEGEDALTPFVVWRTDALEPLPEQVEEPAVEGEGEGEGDSTYLAVVWRTVHEHDKQIDYCYQREAAKRPDLAGEVDIQLSVGPDGSVITADVGRSTLGNVTVESCLASRFRRMQFERPDSGKVEVVRLPFVFPR
ncbi:MAG: AgmX/PglI C-terminal domain-containing protein [Myxococcota bacterium]